MMIPPDYIAGLRLEATDLEGDGVAKLPKVHA